MTSTQTQTTPNPPPADLAVRPCDGCGGTMEEVVYAQEGVRRGWYCPVCGEFVRAVWRERIIE